MMKGGKWVAAVAGGVMAAIVAGAAGCINPVGTVDWAGAVSEDAAAGVDGASGGAFGDAASGDARGGTGIVGEEFTLSLRVGEEGSGSGRSVMGPDAGGIELGKIRNIAQIIAVDAATGVVAANSLDTKDSDNDPGMSLEMSLETGKRYHFLVLMGHRERNYSEESPGDTSPYKYFEDQPPTLLAAGFLGDQMINGATTLSITMKPLVVDTVFEYGGVTAPAVLPDQTKEKGIQLPSETAARMVWTVSGGFATLVDAQTRAGIPGGINWGGLSLAGQETILRFDGDDTDTVAPAVLGGANHNQIVLDLETQKAGVSGSANFKLTYNPLGVNTGEGTSLWIIRNGVNDEAQNSKTTFARDSNGKILWKGTTADKENGNGAVAFEFVDDVISNVDLTKLVPAPVTGKMPVTGAFDEGTYTGIVEWKAVVGGTSKPRFEGETVYMATVTNLAAKDGFSFSPEFTVTHSGSSGILHTPGDAAEAKVLFPKTGFWEYDGPFSGIDYDPLNMDSAIDIIRLAKEESWNSLSLKLLPWQETVDIRASGTDIGKEEGLKLTATNSPAAVILDGGGKTIPLTAGNTGSVITVGVGVTLTLQNITFQGLGTNTAPLIKVDGGTLVLENGAVITGNGNTNTNTGVTVNGGGVYMDGGTFTMSGGVISGSAKYAGGVYVNGGTFTMSGGVINGNARHSGGGVYMTGSSKFNMSGGTIKGETTDIFSSMGGGVYMNGGEFTMEGTAIISGKSGGDVGGGVYMTGSSKFNMSGGEISNSNAGSNSDGGGVYMTGSEFTMSGGKISNNTARGGGGVFMVNNSTFMMTGGKISDNTATTTTGGGMIVGSSSTFTMISGAISGNTASGSGGGVVVSGTFTKTKGIIYGDVGDPRGNTAGGSGHAVYVDNGGKKRDSTADATISLDSTKFSDEGGWEE